MSDLPVYAAPPRPSWAAHPLVRLVHDRNPFYLLSAASMFVGFRVVLAALNSVPGDWRTLLDLIVTLQAYECVLIGLGLVLIVRRGLRRDGWILLGIDALFMVDLTNLNAELFTATPRLGSVVNGVCFLLAMAKVAVVCRTLNVRLSPATTLYVAAQLAFLLALPGVFRLLRSPHATVSAVQIYGLWWAVGLLLAVGAAVVRRGPRTSPMAALPFRLYVLVPLGSLLVHLANENRVFWVHFDAANLAPVLLAGVVLVHRFAHPAWQVRASVVLVGLAALLSLDAGPATTTHLLGTIATPLRVALAVGALSLLAIAVVHRSPLAATVLAGCAALSLLGSTPGEIVARLGRFVRAAADLGWRLVPDTGLAWGYAAIVAAFVLLGVGAAVSLRGTPPPSTPTAA